VLADTFFMKNACREMCSGKVHFGKTLSEKSRSTIYVYF